LTVSLDVYSVLLDSYVVGIGSYQGPKIGMMSLCVSQVPLADFLGWA